MVTANVPSAKKLIVHGPDLSCIPSQFPIQEVRLRHWFIGVITVFYWRPAHSFENKLRLMPDWRQNRSTLSRNFIMLSINWKCLQCGFIQNCFPSLTPHPIIWRKKNGFWALHLAGRSELHFSFNKWKQIFIFFIFGCWLLPKNFSNLRKKIALPESVPVPQARMPMPLYHWNRPETSSCSIHI